MHGRDAARGVGAAVACALLAAALLVAALTLAIGTVSLSPARLADAFLRNGDLNTAGLDADAARALAVRVSEYLSGRVAELQIELPVRGEARGFFTERELLHMADVRALFGLNGTVAVSAAAVAGLMLLLLWRCARRGGGARDRATAPAFSARGYYAGAALVLLLLGALALIVARDFNAAFLAFHQMFFHNDLWLLTEGVDLFISLLPERTFAEYAASIAGRAAALAAGVLIAPAALRACRWAARRGRRG